MLEAWLLEAREEMAFWNQAMSAKLLAAMVFRAVRSTRPRGQAAAHNGISPGSREGVLGCGSMGCVNLRYTETAGRYPTHVY